MAAAKVGSLVGLTVRVQDAAQAVRWYPALLSGELIGGIIGRRPNTAVKLLPDPEPFTGEALAPFIQFPFFGVAASSMQKGVKDLTRFGGPVVTEGETLSDLSTLLDFPQPSNNRKLPSAALAVDPSGNLCAGVWHVFSRNSVAALLLAHDDLPAAEAVYRGGLGVWETASPADTRLVHARHSDLPPSLRTAPSAGEGVNERITLHFSVPDVDAAHTALQEAGCATVPAPPVPPPFGGSQGGAFLAIDPTGYSLMVTQAHAP